MPSERKIQILVAHDHEIVRSGVKALLAGTEIKVLAEATTGQAAVKLALEKEVDLVLLDVRMPDGDGLTALGRIKLDKPDLPVLLFYRVRQSCQHSPSDCPGGQRLLVEGLFPRPASDHHPGCCRWRERLEPSEASQIERCIENATACRKSRSFLERT